MVYYTSKYSGEEIDTALDAVFALTKEKTVAELLAEIASLKTRIEALEGGTV